MRRTLLAVVAVVAAISLLPLDAEAGQFVVDDGRVWVMPDEASLNDTFARVGIDVASFSRGGANTTEVDLTTAFGFGDSATLTGTSGTTTVTVAVERVGSNVFFFFFFFGRFNDS